MTDRQSRRSGLEVKVDWVVAWLNLNNLGLCGLLVMGHVDVLDSTSHLVNGGRDNRLEGVASVLGKAGEGRGSCLLSVSVVEGLEGGGGLGEGDSLDRGRLDGHSLCGRLHGNELVGGSRCGIAGA